MTGSILNIPKIARRSSKYSAVFTPRRLARILNIVLLGSCGLRSEEHTSELQSLMRSSYAVFCLKKKTKKKIQERKDYRSKTTHIKKTKKNIHIINITSTA